MMTRSPMVVMAVLLGIALPLVAGAANEKPNVVFILVDDLGWSDLGFMGSRLYRTPHIDRLAANGMVFTDAYSNAPNCAPTRACIMTGLYTPRHGIYTVGSSARGNARNRKLVPTPNTTVLADRFVTIAEALSKAGYATASMGKWHLGDDPRSQGFDINVAGDKRGHPRTYFSPYGNENLEDGPEGEYLTDRLTDEAIAFIEKNRARPFFLYLPHFAVHTPIQAKSSITAKYKEAAKKAAPGDQSNPKYAAMIESVDQSVGRVLAKLLELELDRRTVVIFFSDNGGHGVMTSNRPLRGSKGMLYEGGIRVPLIVRWPGKVGAGSNCATPVISVDFYPTLLALTGTPRPKGVELDGVDLTPLLTHSGPIERDAIYWHFPAYLQPYSKSQGLWRTTPAGAIRMGNLKLLEFFEDGRRELYDLRADIGESRDLCAERPKDVAKLHEALSAWRKQVKAPVPVEREPRYRK